MKRALDVIVDDVLVLDKPNVAAEYPTGDEVVHRSRGDEHLDDLCGRLVEGLDRRKDLTLRRDRLGRREQPIAPVFVDGKSEHLAAILRVDDFSNRDTCGD